MVFIMTIAEDGQTLICRIYEKHHKRMLYTAARILGNERGEDAVHDVFVKIIEKFEKNYEVLGDKPGQYFVILVRNHSIDLLRRERTMIQPLEDDDIFDETLSNPEDELLENESMDELVSLIRRLKPSARELLEYKYMLEYSNKEIAEIFDISQTAVSTRLNKAKGRLREIIEGEGAFDHAYERS